MPSFSPYSTHQWRYAVSLSGPVAYNIILIVSTAPILLSSDPWYAAVVYILAFALVGTPIALMVSWVFLSGLLWYLMRRRISWGVATLWGAIIPVVAIVTYSFVINTIGKTEPGWTGPVTRDWTVSAQHQFLTSFQWQATFVGTCVATALFVRFCLGPGRQPEAP